MKKQNFTLVEMLTVIAIIAVLMGMLIPAINSMKEKAKQTKAKAEINTLLTAIKSYESTYGILPIPVTTVKPSTGVYAAPANNVRPSGSHAPGLVDPAYATIKDIIIDGNDATSYTDNDGKSYTSLDNYDRLIGWLTLVPPRTDTSGNKVWAPGTWDTPSTLTGIQANARKIKFLDPAASEGGVTYLDPWGNPYVIVFDANYNGQVCLKNDTNGFYAPVYCLYGSVFIYSRGPNRMDDCGVSAGVNFNKKVGVDPRSSSDKNGFPDDIGSWHK